MSDINFTDPLAGITEGFVSQAKEAITGVKHGDVLPPDDSMPITITLQQLATDYNKADLNTQLKFVQLLVNHDFDKIQEALTKRIK